MASLSEERYQQLLEYLRGSRIGSPVYPLGFSANDKRGLRMARARGDDVIQIGVGLGLGLGPYLYNIIPPSPSHPAGRLCRQSHGACGSMPISCSSMPISFYPPRGWDKISCARIKFTGRFYPGGLEYTIPPDKDLRG